MCSLSFTFHSTGLPEFSSCVVLLVCIFYLVLNICKNMLLTGWISMNFQRLYQFDGEAVLSLFLEPKTFSLMQLTGLSLFTAFKQTNFFFFKYWCITYIRKKVSHIRNIYIRKKKVAYWNLFFISHTYKYILKRYKHNQALMI